MNVGLSTLQDIGSRYVPNISTEEKTDKTPAEEKLEEAEGKTKKSKEEKKSSQDLTPEEEQQVQKLQARDTEVRAHESAHQAAGAGMTGAASFSYQQGPDGKMYAIGGEVSISMKSGSTPEETIANARKIVAAAMAPANPSPQDHAVASSARVMEMKAQQQLAREKQEEALGKETYKQESGKQETDPQNNQENSSQDPLDISA